MLPIAIGVTASACTPFSATSARTQNALAEPQVLAQKSRVQRVRFDPGKSSTTIKDSVLNGTRDIYLLGAQKGQTMVLKIASLEDNAVFDVATPPTKAGQRRMLKQGAVAWAGKLPESGEYQVIVGPTRGNASYRLQVAIK